MAADSDIPKGSSSEVLQERQRKEDKKRLEPRKDQEVSLEIKRLEKKEEGADRPFYVRKIVLRPHSTIPAGKFETLWPEDQRQVFLKGYENRQMTFDELKGLTQKLEEQYRKRDYVAFVYIPPQAVQNDEIVLEVLLARLGEIHFKGLRYYRKWRTEAYWRSRKGELLQANKIRRNLFFMNENPDRVVQPVLKPGEETGETDIFLEAKEKFPIHAGYALDNQGVKLTGRRRNGFWLQHNNLLGLDDILYVGTVFGKHFAALNFQHLIPITPWGTRFISGFGHARVHPKQDFESAGVHASSQIYSLALRQWLWTKEYWDVDSYVGFDFKDKRTRAFERQVIFDRFGVLSFGGDTRIRDVWGNWRAGQDFFFGLSPHGDDFPLTTRRAETNFFKYGFWVQREQRLPLGMRAVISLEGQLSPDKLVPQEELFLGGSSTVRGYPQSDYGADQGLLARYEWWVPFFIVPQHWKLPWEEKGLRDQIQLLGFFDEGYGRLRDPRGTEIQARHYAGIGGGFAVYFRSNIYALFEWAAPTGQHALTESGPSQFYFSLRVER